MAKFTNVLRKLCLMAVCIVLGGKAANATLYTAVASGNFNAGTTWVGGSAPGALLSTDQVVIPPGFMVTMTGNEVFSGTSSLTVMGTLNAMPATALSITSGTLAGAGTISADSMMLGLTSAFTFTGSVTANKLASMGATIGTAANITVNKALDLESGVFTVGAGSLIMGNMSKINLEGGTLATTGLGLLGLDSMYNVNYMATGSTLAGMELSGLGIDSIMVNTTGSVMLAGNTTINGALSLTSGTLALAGNTLSFGPTAKLVNTGSGTLKGSTLSNIVVNTTGGLIGALRFATGTGDSLNNLTINTTTGTTTLGSNLNVNNMLTLTSGALAIGANTLTLNAAGNIASGGTGMLTGSTLSNLVINSAAGLATPLIFTAGSNMLNNLTLNSTTGGATLGSDLGLSGMLTLTSGTLWINGHTLILNPTANVAATGTGMLAGSATSNLVVNTTGSLSGALNFASGSNMLNNLTLNTGSGANAPLGSDLNLNGVLTLTAGNLWLNGHTLTLNSTSDISATGTGSLMGSGTSNLVVNSTGGLTGMLHFATGTGDSLNNLTLNTVTGTTTLGSDLNINHLLTMTSGNLAIGANTLTLNAAGNIAAGGTGVLTGSTASNLVINSTAGLTNPLMFTAGSNMLNNLTLNSTTGGATLGSDLGLSGMLTLSAGTLSLSGHTLSLNPTANVAATGSGMLAGTATSNLVVNTTGSLTGAIRFATGSNLLNNLTVNTGAGSGVSLGSDLNLDGMLTLTAGKLSINGHTLTLNSTGDIAATGAGTILGSGSSSLVVNTTGGLTGILHFATGTGDSLANLTINTISGTTTLGSDLNINHLLTLTSGNLAIGGNTLTVNAAGNIAGTGTGMITGGTTANLVINSTSGLFNALVIGSGILNNLTVNSTTGGDTLSGDLTINGLFTLTSGTLWLNGHTLTLGTTAGLAATGTGMLAGSNTSNLIVNSTSGLSGAVRFAPGTNILNNLTVNTGAGAGMSLGSNLTVNGLVTLTAGMLSLNGNTLTLSSTGNLSATGTGMINGSSTSSLVVNTTDGLTGMLNFAAGTGNTLRNLVVNTAIGGATLGSDLNIENLLSLNSGTLSLNGQTLTLNAGADISGTGMLNGSAASSLVVNSNFSLTSPLQFATGGNMLNNLTLNMGSGSDNIMLGSNVSVQGMLSLTTGKLTLGANTLSIAPGAMVMGGSENSYVVTNGSGSMMMNLATGTSDTFKVGTTASYAPMALLANAGASTGNVNVNVANSVLTGGYTGSVMAAPMVNATWFVSSTASTVNYNMTAMWTGGLEVNGFNRADAYISHYTGGAWDMQTPAAASTVGDLYSIIRSGLTSLSPFMVTSSSALSVPAVAGGGAGVSIFPNPATSILNFATTAAISNIDISDLAGQVVKSTNGLTPSVSVSELPAGVYFIHFYGTDVNTVLKFVKD